ncbi:MAG: Pyruvate, phosphate dikinase [Firmicutes bacterium ADurb.Bin080]|jgi:pyruvate, orthophosphate dikinase|nr:pyruvate, phosphate dikinase [Clostridiales bacterium]OQC13322.1 MAG: Pyruvate, phosphate dikinase [Firmicutes bacterium ADurb.Bin080]
MTKFVYLFREADGKDKAKFGGKGANLAEMTKLGMPVPPGFTITTEACTAYYKDGKKINSEINEEIFKTLAILEKETDKKFGSIENPFLVSVRSGARASMPGMMDTILNLGLNDISVEGLARLTDNPRFAYDCYRRFIQMYSDVVIGIGKNFFEKIIDDLKLSRGVKLDTDLKTEDLKELVSRFKAFYKKSQGQEFPQDPKVQLVGAVEAVFRSWDNPRANVYRRMNNIPSDWGTAVNVQSMVFGNMGDTSGTGVAFTRNPSTGEKKLYGEYLMNAQGEDVVAGIRTPSTIDHLKVTNAEVYNQFVEIANKLEKYFHDMQDMEFTIERGKLYMLQTRNGKRTAQAAVRVAVELVEEGLCSQKEALLKIEPKQLDDLLHPTFSASELKKWSPIASGLPASPGAASGKIAFSAEEAKIRTQAGEKVVLVRLETSPEDIEGMHCSEGILTARGGLTSHAAVVARGMGTCCVSGCGELIINEEEKTLTVNGKKYGPDDVISIDGSTGNIYAGTIPTVNAEISGHFRTIMDWANATRTLKVRANADNPKDAKTAYEFGAQGIGLCRTEHMFFEETRIKSVREMIIADTEEARRKALAKLLPMQREDFIGIYKEMKGNPVTIRFLDPPLHEFLPHKDTEMVELAKDLGVSFEKVKETVESLKESNPMLGHRGCRLAVTFPEIAEMQTRAVIEAAIAVNKEGGNVKAEIMIPLVGEVKELAFVKGVVVETAEKVMKEAGTKVEYSVGTMIEIPRAAITADKIATEADFFSFGTNDLTQMTFGFSRDDAGKFLPFYYGKRIFESDPFQRLDVNGVGELVKLASEKGRATNPKIKLGICGEHGGDPYTIEFCHSIGLNYVSCSPFRVPIAILAAAQAAINSSK